MMSEAASSSALAERTRVKELRSLALEQAQEQRTDAIRHAGIHPTDPTARSAAKQADDAMREAELALEAASLAVTDEQSRLPAGQRAALVKEMDDLAALVTPSSVLVENEALIARTVEAARAFLAAAPSAADLATLEARHAGRCARIREIAKALQIQLSPTEDGVGRDALRLSPLRAVRIEVSVRMRDTFGSVAPAAGTWLTVAATPTPDLYTAPPSPYT